MLDQHIVILSRSELLLSCMAQKNLFKLKQLKQSPQTKSASV